MVYPQSQVHTASSKQAGPYMLHYYSHNPLENQNKLFATKISTSLTSLLVEVENNLRPRNNCGDSDVCRFCWWSMDFCREWGTRGS
uniref:Uncharacterized protein n=1 Tax=Oryza glumipatula TaxID=40148 RepID=A0A0E0AZF8_9ORYZ